MERQAASSLCSFGSDLALAQAAAAGNPHARRLMVGRLLRRVRTTVRYIVHNDADADDIAQGALIEILQIAGSFRGEASLEVWADRISVHHAFHTLRKRRRRFDLFRQHVETQGESVESYEPDICSHDLRRRLALLLSRLSPSRRAVVVLKLVHHYQVREIADILEVPVNTVRDRLRTARQQLRRDILSDAGMREWLDLREE